MFVASCKILIVLPFQHLEPGTEPFTPEQEFGEMTLSDYDSDEDADYAPSDSEESSDDLEYDSGATVSSASEEELEEVFREFVEQNDGEAGFVRSWI